MIVQIEITGDNGATAVIYGADNLRELSVVVPQDTDATTIGLALAGLGRLEGPDLVWLNITELRAVGGLGQPASWQLEFDAMIEFAGKHGWVDDTGHAVRAHLELHQHHSKP